jgi:hypothetical protein
MLEAGREEDGGDGGAETWQMERNVWSRCFSGNGEKETI